MCSAPCLRSVFHRRRVIETVSVFLSDEQWPCLDHAFQDSINCSGNPIRTLPCLSEVPPRPHVIKTFLSDEQWSCLDTPMKTASNCLEKPICAPPRLSEVSTTIDLETVSVSITPLKTYLSKGSRKPMRVPPRLSDVFPGRRLSLRQFRCYCLMDTDPGPVLVTAWNRESPYALCTVS